MNEFSVFCLKIAGRISYSKIRGSWICNAVPLWAQPIMDWVWGDSRRRYTILTNSEIDSLMNGSSNKEKIIKIIVYICFLKNWTYIKFNRLTFCYFSYYYFIISIHISKVNISTSLSFFVFFSLLGFFLSYSLSLFLYRWIYTLSIFSCKNLLMKSEFSLLFNPGKYLWNSPILYLCGCIIDLPLEVFLN